MPRAQVPLLPTTHPIRSDPASPSISHVRPGTHHCAAAMPAHTSPRVQPERRFAQAAMNSLFRLG